MQLCKKAVEEASPLMAKFKDVAPSVKVWNLPPIAHFLEDSPTLDADTVAMVGHYDVCSKGGFLFRKIHPLLRLSLS